MTQNNSDNFPAWKTSNTIESKKPLWGTHAYLAEKKLMRTMMKNSLKWALTHHWLHCPSSSLGTILGLGLICVPQPPKGCLLVREAPRLHRPQELPLCLLTDTYLSTTASGALCQSAVYRKAPKPPKARKRTLPDCAARFLRGSRSPESPLRGMTPTTSGGVGNSQACATVQLDKHTIQR